MRGIIVLATLSYDFIQNPEFQNIDSRIIAINLVDVDYLGENHIENNDK